MDIKLKTGVQSEFYLCLARAFLPPLQPAAFDAITRFLAEDLSELNDALNYPISDQLAELQCELARVPDQSTLLRIYSSLFLDPGSRIPINAGMYLDGAMMGGAVARMEECYRNSGLEKSEGFHDLSDHVAVQLEFVSHLYARAGQSSAQQGAAALQGSDFLHLFVAAWAPCLRSEIDAAARRLSLPANPYHALARIVEIAALIDAEAANPVLASARQQTNIEKARAKRSARGVTGDDMIAIEARLREHGLATDHLHIPLDDRDSEMGFSRAIPPEPLRKM
ncbi:MAG TPA: molecular chaperone TorD family protein [Noviherbaspirillum sp.]